MPAFAKSRVGSSRGTTGEELTSECSCLSAKYEVNVERTRAAGHSSFADDIILAVEAARRVACLRRDWPGRRPLIRRLGVYATEAATTIIMGDITSQVRQEVALLRSEVNGEALKWHLDGNSMAPK